MALVTGGNSLPVTAPASDSRRTRLSRSHEYLFRCRLAPRGLCKLYPRRMAALGFRCCYAVVNLSIGHPTSFETTCAANVKWSAIKIGG
jgi:hypothetical protein